MSGETDLDRRPSAADTRVSESVPVIDIGDLTGAAGESGERAIDEIAAACREWGFFQVVNHGIGDDLGKGVGLDRLGLVGFAETTLVGRDHPKAGLDEHGDLVAPQARGVGEPVQHEHRVAAALVGDLEAIVAEL